MLYRGFFLAYKNGILRREFFRNFRVIRGSIMSQENPPKVVALSMKDVTRLPVSELNRTYGDTESIFIQIESILEALSKPDSFSLIETQFIYDKKWTYYLNLPFDSSIQSFRGIGMTKSTAEHNCKLTALLWLENQLQLSKSNWTDFVRPVESLVTHTNDYRGVQNLISVFDIGVNKLNANIFSPVLHSTVERGEMQHSLHKLDQEGSDSVEGRTISKIQMRLQVFENKKTSFNGNSELLQIHSSDTIARDTDPVNPDAYIDLTISSELGQSQSSEVTSVIPHSSDLKRNFTVNCYPVRWYLGLNKTLKLEKSVTGNDSVVKSATKAPYKFDWNPVKKYLGFNAKVPCSDLNRSELIRLNHACFGTENRINMPSHVKYSNIFHSNVQTRLMSTSAVNMKYEEDDSKSSHSGNQGENGVQDLRTLLNKKLSNKIVEKANVNQEINEIGFEHMPEAAKASSEVGTNHLNLLMSNVQKRLMITSSVKMTNEYEYSKSSAGVEQHDISREKSVQDAVQDHRTFLNQKCSNQISEQTNISHEIREIEYEHSPEATNVDKIFPQPKQILHNYYQMLSQQLKKKFDISPQYKTVGNTKSTSLWLCTYRLHWPMECKISAKAHTKKEASSLAALQALKFLQEEKKITKEGFPSIFTKEEVHDVTQDKIEFKLSEETLLTINRISDLYNRNILPNIMNLNSLTSEHKKNAAVFSREDSLDLSVIHTQKYLGFDVYLAKEKLDLPIVQQKSKFIELFEANKVVIIKGEPGCGKSTRIPQYVLEAWAHKAQPSKPCRIAVTQPRKIAAISLAERVSSERLESLGSIVGYQVRLDSNFKARTGRILYCTPGILLRHFQADPYLRKFTCVILDEAHERDVNVDLLSNLLKKTMEENENLKVIVMSATIETDLFQQYFPGAAVLNVPGMTYPVNRFFLDNCRDLDLTKTLKMCGSQYPAVVHEDVAKVIGYIHKNKPEGAILVFLPGWDDIMKVRKLMPRKTDLMVLPLHSKLQHSEQTKIFSKPPPGIRKIILATNIAETSITIDDIVYVVDTGIFKSQVYDVQKSVNVMDNKWVSKASVAQRSGRAGRCQPGESFHLYTTAKFNYFVDFKVPEILETSLTKIVLDSKMFSDNKNAVDWMNDLPTPPRKSAVLEAVNALKDLELLDSNENLTALGRSLVDFQLEPKLAKILEAFLYFKTKIQSKLTDTVRKVSYVLNWLHPVGQSNKKTMVDSVIFKCTTPIVDIVTLFSTDVDMFESAMTEKETVRNCKLRFSKTSDHLAVLRIFEKWLEITEEMDPRTEARFTDSYNLVLHRLRYIEKLRAVHFGYLRNGLYESVPITDDFSDSDEIVKGVLFGGLGNLLCVRNWDFVKNRIRHKHVLITKNNHKAQITQESVNFKKMASHSSQKFFTYINETLSNVRKTTVVRETSVIPNISVILFSNNEIEMSEIENLNGDMKNKVKLDLKNIACFICDKKEAHALIQCRVALRDCYKYYVYQLTSGGDSIPQVDGAWLQILTNLNRVLEDYKSE